MGLKDLVHEYIDTCILNGVSFSAYDITKSIRNDAPQEDVPHADVRSYVHDYMAYRGGNEYTKTTKTWPNGEESIYYVPNTKQVIAPQLSATVDWDDGYVVDILEEDPLPSNKGVTVWKPT